MASALACAAPTPPTPAPLPAELEACDAFCAVLEHLQCADGTGSPGADETFGTDDDVACVDVCTDTVHTYRVAPDRVCLDSVTSCDAAEACVFGGAE